jgi:hypothetical protein
MTEQRIRSYVSDAVIKQAESWLSDDEKLLFVAKPDPMGAMLNVSNCLVVVSGIIFVTFFGVLPAARSQELPIQALCIVAGFALLYLVMSYFAETKTIYVLTNKRAIIGTYPSLKSYGRRDITTLRIQRRNNNNKGNLIFASEPMGNYTRDVGFFAIDQVEDVRRLMIEVFEFDDADFWSR